MTQNMPHVEQTQFTISNLSRSVLISHKRKLLKSQALSIGYACDTSNFLSSWGHSTELHVFVADCTKVRACPEGLQSKAN